MLTQFLRLSESLIFCSLEIEVTSHYLLLLCHHFSHHCVGLMNSVKSICGNFNSMPDNVKKYLLLFDDSDLRKTEIKLFWKQLQVIQKIIKDSLVLFLNNVSLLNHFHL